MLTDNYEFGPSQWKKETPTVIDNIYHGYLFLWAIWMLIAGSKYVMVSDKAVLIATWISGMMLPVIYSFCRCFGCKVPDDIPAEHTVTPADPRMQAIIDKLDAISNQAAKADTRTLVTDIASGDLPKAVQDVVKSAIPVSTIPQALAAIPRCATTFELSVTIPQFILSSSQPVKDAYDARMAALENLESLK